MAEKADLGQTWRTMAEERKRFPKSPNSLPNTKAPSPPLSFPSETEYGTHNL